MITCFSFTLLLKLLSGQSTRPVLKPNTPTHPPTVVPSPSHSTAANYPASLASRKRGRTFEFDLDSSKRRRGAPSYSSRQSGEKQHNKGLRHFSQRVCEKVREKGATTYNEVKILFLCVYHVCIFKVLNCSVFPGQNFKQGASNVNYCPKSNPLLWGGNVIIPFTHCSYITWSVFCVGLFVFHILIVV